ncbi:hypothetical protein LguiB_027588 [Lonicera macranthoides]
MVKSREKKITFNLKGQIIQGKNEFKARGLELLKTHIGLAFDDWRHVPDKKKEDMFETLLDEFDFPPEEKDAVFTQLGVQLKTWKKNVRNKYFGNTRESVLAYKDKVLESVQVSLSAWNTFIDREATPEKLAQRCKAKHNRSKKTDAHYLGRTSYAEKEEICMSVEKRKPDPIELYVDARKNPKTKLCHPGAVSDVEQIIAIRSTQDEASKGSIETDALTRHFGKDKIGRTRGVGSTVARTKLKATLPIRNELEQMKTSVQSTNDSLDDLKSTMSHILKVVQVYFSVIAIVHCSKKSATGSPSMPTSGSSKSYKLMHLDGSKSIAQVTIVKTAPGSLVHGRPLLPFKVKIAVVKVFQGMGDEPLWKGNQGGADTLGETEGGYLVSPKYLMEEVTGDNCMPSTLRNHRFSPADTNLVVREFEKCGVILKHVPGPRDANWMHILNKLRCITQWINTLPEIQIRELILDGASSFDFNAKNPIGHLLPMARKEAMVDKKVSISNIKAVVVETIIHGVLQYSYLKVAFHLVEKHCSTYSDLYIYIYIYHKSSTIEHESERPTLLNRAATVELLPAPRQYHFE